MRELAPNRPRMPTHLREPTARGRFAGNVSRDLSWWDARLLCR